MISDLKARVEEAKRLAKEHNEMLRKKKMENDENRVIEKSHENGEWKSFRKDTDER